MESMVLYIYLFLFYVYVNKRDDDNELQFNERAPAVAANVLNDEDDDDDDATDSILMMELSRNHQVESSSNEKTADHSGIRNLDVAPPAMSNFSFGGVLHRFDNNRACVPDICRFGFCYIKAELVLTVTYPNLVQERAIIPFPNITKLKVQGVNFKKIDNNNLNEYQLFTLCIELSTPMNKIERKIDRGVFTPFVHGTRFTFESTTNIASQNAAWAKEIRLVFKGTLKPHKTFVDDVSGNDPNRVRVSFVRDGRASFEECTVAPGNLRNWTFDFLNNTSAEMLNPSNNIPMLDNNEAINVFNNDSPALKATDSVASFVEKMKMINDVFLFSSNKAKKLLFFQICKVCGNRKYISHQGWSLTNDDSCHGACMNNIINK